MDKLARIQTLNHSAPLSGLKVFCLSGSGKMAVSRFNKE